VLILMEVEDNERRRRLEQGGKTFNPKAEATGKIGRMVPLRGLTKGCTVTFAGTAA
jgi:hypothetical protein